MVEIVKELEVEEVEGKYRVLNKHDSELVRAHWRSKYLHLPKPWETSSLWVGPMKLSTGYSRLVVGDHGAYLEIPREKMLLENLVIPPKQAFRKQLLSDVANLVLKDPGTLKKTNKYHMKYVWLEPKDREEKIYLQAETVKYADYKVGMFYIHPLLVDFKTGSDN